MRMNSLSRLSAVLIVVLAMPSAAEAAESNFSCSVPQGFNFQKDSQETVGFIHSLKIGETVLAADIAVSDPENVSHIMKVTAVVGDIHWNGGYSDPVQFSAQVLTDNKNLLSVLQHKTLANTEVEFTFSIYDYDPRARRYFKAFHSGEQVLRGLIEKSGGTLMLNIAGEVSSDVPSPMNFTLGLGVMPQDQSMEIQLGFAVDQKLVKKWGVAVGALLLPHDTSRSDRGAAAR